MTPILHVLHQSSCKLAGMEGWIGLLLLQDKLFPVLFWSKEWSCWVRSWSSFLGPIESTVLQCSCSALGSPQGSKVASFLPSLFCCCLAEILNQDGTINRRVLGAKVFGNQVRVAQSLAMFNQGAHPLLGLFQPSELVTPPWLHSGSDMWRGQVTEVLSL